MKRASAFVFLLGALLLLASLLPTAGTASRPLSPSRDLKAQGAALFRAKGCMTCHRHAAVDAISVNIGPDLSRYQADPDFLRRWLADPSAVRPGTQMPTLGLAPAEIEALIAFLQAP